MKIENLQQQSGTSLTVNQKVIIQPKKEIFNKFIRIKSL